MDVGDANYIGDNFDVTNINRSKTFQISYNRLSDSFQVSIMLHVIEYNSFKMSHFYINLRLKLSFVPQ